MVTGTLDRTRRAEPVGIHVEAADDASAWDAYVSGRDDATGYHQWRWREVFERAFGHRCVYLAARSAGRVTGVLPVVELRSRLFGTLAVSLPFVNYGGLVADGQAAARALLGRAAAISRERGWRHLELRHRCRMVLDAPAKQHKVAMRLALPPDGETLWSSLDRKVRNQVRKAEKSGCSVEDGHAELLDAFYPVFAHNMRDLGTPVYARRFFDAVLAAFPNDTRVFVVRVDGRPAAASITIRWRDSVEVPWASSLRDYNDKSPNMLLYWAMLRASVACGGAVFDFGRSTPGEGTFHFKRQWGAVPVQLSWEYPGLAGLPPDHGPTNPKFRLAIAAWQRLPVPVATALGPAIVRNIP
jgi:FemAB-related protein (PEP-CTERM system-associated)